MGKSQRVTEGLLRGFGQQSEEGGANRFPLSNSVAPVADLDTYDPFPTIVYSGVSPVTGVGEFTFVEFGGSQVPCIWRWARCHGVGFAATLGEIAHRYEKSFTATSEVLQGFAGSAGPEPKYGLQCFEGAAVVSDAGPSWYSEAPIGGPLNRGLFSAWPFTPFVLPPGQVVRVIFRAVGGGTLNAGATMEFGIGVSEIGA